jgi:hypothetical protein
VQFQRVSWCNGLFVDRFKRRDWGGERELISAHARLVLPIGSPGSLRTRLISSITNAGPGPGNWPWVKWTVNRWWSFSDGCGQLVNVTGQKIERIADYIHCPWVIPAAASVPLAGTT